MGTRSTVAEPDHPVPELVVFGWLCRDCGGEGQIWCLDHWLDDEDVLRSEGYWLWSGS